MHSCFSPYAFSLSAAYCLLPPVQRSSDAVALKQSGLSALRSLSPARSRILLKFTPWNQILCLNRLSPALPVTQLLQKHNYQSPSIPLGFTPWNQILCLNRLSPALPVTQLLQKHNYQSPSIPLGFTPWNQNTCLKHPSLQFQATQAYHARCHRFSVIPLGRLGPFLNCDEVVARLSFSPFARVFECWEVSYSPKKRCRAMGRLVEQESRAGPTRCLDYAIRQSP
jgi:hypothetical protein